MIRIEIIANRSVEENVLDALRDHGVGKCYTKYPSIYGVGAQGPRMGDSVWPEENFVLVIWCEEEEARGIAGAIATVKGQFPGEGIKLFGLPDPGQPAASTQQTATPLAPPPAAPTPEPPHIGPVGENI